jgi:hypothetical protein
MARHQGFQRLSLIVALVGVAVLVVVVELAVVVPLV